MAFIEKRKGRWYAVNCVPASLRPDHGKSNLVRSLGTHDRAKAQSLIETIAAQWQGELANAKKRLDDRRDKSLVTAALGL